MESLVKRVTLKERSSSEIKMEAKSSSHRPTDEGRGKRMKLHELQASLRVRFNCCGFIVSLYSYGLTNLRQSMPLSVLN